MTINFDSKQLTSKHPSDETLDCRVQLDCSIAELLMLCQNMGDTDGWSTLNAVEETWGVQLYEGNENTADGVHYCMYEQLDDFLKSIGYHWVE